MSPLALPASFTLIAGDTAHEAAHLSEEAQALAALLPQGRRVGLDLTDTKGLIVALLACAQNACDLYVIRDPLAPPPDSEGLAALIGRRVSKLSGHAEGSGRLVLQSSGTTGAPKWASHALEALLARIQPGREAAVWLLAYGAGTFAGMQVILSAMVGGHTLVSGHQGASAPQLADLALARGVTHVSATPSFWRALLFHPQAARLPLKAITLGGEASDQGLLDRLKRLYPQAVIRHLYATSEDGLVFAVSDGLAGFPARWLMTGIGPAKLSLSERGTLMVSLNNGPLRDTGDHVERIGERCLFAGRADSMVNIGGTKVFPESIEAHLTAHALVAEALVSAKRNPITGAILVADLVLTEPLPADEAKARLKAHISLLPRAAQPAIMRFVAELPLNASGKKARA